MTAFNHLIGRRIQVVAYGIRRAEQPPRELVLPGRKFNEIAIDMVAARLNAMIAQ